MCRSLLMVTLGVGIAGSGQKNRAAYAAFGSLGTPRRCPTSVWNAVRLQRGTASAITLEHCPPSAWNRVRHRVEYAGYIFLRWREAGGDKRHLSWEESADIYLTYTERLRGWYSDITGRAQLANEAHNHLRNEYRATRRRLETSGRSVFARQIR